MPGQPLDYRQPTTLTAARPFPVAILLISTASLLVGSLAWCVATLRTPGRFIFIPAGDVGLGFKSHAGWLQWVEYAPWVTPIPDYPSWSIPWPIILVVEAFPVLMILRRRLRRAAARCSSDEGSNRTDGGPPGELS